MVGRFVTKNSLNKNIQEEMRRSRKRVCADTPAPGVKKCKIVSTCNVNEGGNDTGNAGVSGNVTTEAVREISDDADDVDSDSVDEDETATYAGCVDSTGLPHGRGTQHYAVSGMKWEGRFYHGLRHGKGILSFRDGSYIKGRWTRDELQGFAVYRMADDSSIEGNFVDGEVDGFAIELDDKGKVCFRGTFHDNLRHGKGELFLQDGGYVYIALKRHWCE